MVKIEMLRVRCTSETKNRFYKLYHELRFRNPRKKFDLEDFLNLMMDAYERDKTKVEKLIGL